MADEAFDGPDSPEDPTIVDPNGHIGFVGQFQEDIDRIRRQHGLGDRNATFTNVFRGFNHSQVSLDIPFAMESQGLVFFTRPSMMLSNANLSKVRKLTPLLTNEPYSYQAAVRAYLDPDAGRLPPTNPLHFSSPLVDPKMPFIPLLSYALETLSGFPDPQLNTYTSTEGVHKEQWSMVDDMIENLGVFSINANYREIQGGAIALLINTQLTYMSAVYNGLIMPYPKHIVENRIDYQHRIYRLKLDRTRRYVEKIGIVNAAFPYASNLGSLFDYEKKDVMDRKGETISVPYQCIGAEYQDPILIAEFNRLVMMYNPDMMSAVRSSRMRKLQHHELIYFNYHGYPLINPYTSELEWYVPVDTYRHMLDVPEYIPSFHP